MDKPTYRTLFPPDSVGTSTGRQPATRYSIGLAIGKERSLAQGTILATQGRGSALRGRVLADAAAELPQGAVLGLERLVRGAHLSPSDLAEISDGWVDATVSLVHHLLAEVGEAKDDLLLIGVDDVGVWLGEEERDRTFVPLIDAARLAEATGLNVIDAFASRDLAQQGRGGPLHALPLWLLLADRRETGAGRTRVVLDLADTARLIFLPAGTLDDGPDALCGFDVAPVGRLIDHFARQEPKPTLTLDEANQFAVQGQPIEKLEQLWHALPVMHRPPSWHPLGMPLHDWIDPVEPLQRHYDWSMEDMTCTAMRVVADAVARVMFDFLPRLPAVDEIILAGKHRHHGLLLRELVKRMPGVQMTLIDRLGITDASLAAAPPAVLALLYVDQYPAATTYLTGAAAPRVLGRLTRGNPLAWQRLLEQMAATPPPRMSLRSAM